MSEDRIGPSFGMNDDYVVTDKSESNIEVISDFQKELSQLINKHNRENLSDTPDFILAKYLEACLTAYSIAVSRRDQWFQFTPFSHENHK